MTMEYVEIIPKMNLLTEDVPDMVFKLGQFDVASGTKYMFIYLMIGYLLFHYIKKTNTRNGLFQPSSN